MKTTRFEVLSQDEVERIHAASMEILAEVGIKVNYKKARDIFREAGADVNDETFAVKIPEKLIRWAVDQAPKQFSLFGIDASFRLDIGPNQAEPVFAGLGTPTRILDLNSGAVRAATRQDMIDHIILIDACNHIHNSQMDIWPDDIPMTTIHTEAIWAWAHHSRKPYGMGCYGYLPTWDMMRMISIAVGGKAELQKRPRFFAICSVVSPLQMDQAQAEGLLICAEYLCARSHRRDNGSRHPGGTRGAGERGHPGAHHAGANFPPRHACHVWNGLHHCQHALRHGHARLA
jgi:trimethylamine--corrinoid protein Co-methyltransferase